MHGLIIYVEVEPDINLANKERNTQRLQLKAQKTTLVRNLAHEAFMQFLDRKAREFTRKWAWTYWKPYLDSTSGRLDRDLMRGLGAGAQQLLKQARKTSAGSKDGKGSTASKRPGTQRDEPAAKKAKTKTTPQPQLGQRIEVLWPNGQWYAGNVSTPPLASLQSAKGGELFIR